MDDEHHTVDRQNPIRRAVHVTVVRKKLLDEDNFWGGMKLLIDVLKENSLIYDDCPRWCDLSVHQETGKEIGTLVEIT